MGWMGKLFGGSLGFSLGGPLGAVLGAIIGHHIFDSRGRRQTGRGVATEERQTIFYVATFSMLAKLVKSDGRVTREEIAAIETAMREQLRLSADARDFAINIFNEAKTSRDSFADYARQFHAYFHDSAELLALELEMLLMVAVSDGQLHAEEERLLYEAAAIFGMEAWFQELLERARGGSRQDLERHYSVLGCRPGDSLATVKKRYRRLAMEHHPDRVRAKGMPEEFTAVAEEKFKEIQAAYEQVVKDIENRA